MQRTDFDRAMQRLALFPRTPKPAVLDDYWRALKHIHPRLFAAGVEYIVRTGTYYPTPGELRAACIDIIHRKLDLLHPLAAWRAVMDTQWNRPLPLCHVCRTTVERLGGKQNLDDNEWDKRQFVRQYELERENYYVSILVKGWDAVVTIEQDADEPEETEEPGTDQPASMVGPRTPREYTFDPPTEDPVAAWHRSVRALIHPADTTEEQQEPALRTQDPVRMERG